jgi:hypothetical protein
VVLRLLIFSSIRPRLKSIMESVSQGSRKETVAARNIELPARARAVSTVADFLWL